MGGGLVPCGGSGALVGGPCGGAVLWGLEPECTCPWLCPLIPESVTIFKRNKAKQEEEGAYWLRGASRSA